MTKRLFDLSLALLILPLVLLVFLVTASAVRILIGRPIIFAQGRPGLNGVVFKMYKFRTMTEDRDANGNLKPDEERLTAFGRLLRSSSLDELPEIFNVLKGEMSLVGPRPLLVEYLPLYSKEQARRHEVRPGITGWAQVNGRNAISWKQKFELDIWYIDNHSILLDIKILLLTIKKIFLREGISAVNHPTVDKFKGSSK